MGKVNIKHLSSFNFGIETWGYISFSLLLGFLLPWIDNFFFRGWFSPVNQETMISILSAVASGMIALSGIVFSLIFVLVQFGSASYTPRLTRIFAHSYVLRHSLGIFTGTFLYSLMTMRSIGMRGLNPVSGLAVWIAFLWLLASIAILARLIRVFTTLTITNILSMLGRIGQLNISKIYKMHATDKQCSDKSHFYFSQPNQKCVRHIVYKGDPGYITGYNESKLLSIAIANDIVIFLPYSIGDSIEYGANIAVILGDNLSFKEASVYKSIHLGTERLFKNDPRYSFRLLVDMAIRALSPAINDPTTAVQVLDHIQAFLIQLGNSNLDIGTINDKKDAVRIVLNTPRWEDYLQLGLVEIMQYGAGSIQVQRRLKSLLFFLKHSVPVERAKTVNNFIEQRDSLVLDTFSNINFRQLADIADRQGIGSGGDKFDKFISSLS
ncbi:MAG TPA: DUF2254 domain-containing protein [Chitinispirillaceae bacterium]|nr:DUF2254 domain-containing protein [Chitinispirillaceae bacterium]